MAIFDAGFELFDDATLVAATGTDYVGTTAKTIDFTQAGLEMGAGEPVWLNIRVGTTAYAPTTSGDTCDFTLFSDTAAAGHDSNSLIVMASGPREASTLTVGTWVLRAPIPYNVDARQYLSLGVTCNQATTAGTIDAWLDHGPQSSYDTQVSTSNI